MMKEMDLKLLAETRLAESKLLFENNYLEGACYLAFYSIEIGFKASFCKILNIEKYPENIQGLKTHNLQDLLLLSGLKMSFEDSCKSDIMLDASWKSLSLEGKWNETYRYIPIGSKNEGNMMILFTEIEYLFNWIRSKW